ncbi:MAG: LEPR-XLL domain-containing protein, partial [Phycisphaeraceae bacterium]|nr:LEPR-XLL domain-containing protein [Phycisphaeraceae bacterium]
MSLLSWMKKSRKDGQLRAASAHPIQPPTFEQLEPRVLLSADAFAPAENHLYETSFEAAIVVDFEESETHQEHRTQDLELGSEPAEDQITETQADAKSSHQEGLSVSELTTAASLSAVPQNETSPSQAETSEGLEPTTNAPQPTTDATMGSIIPRGPPTDTASLDSSFDLYFYRENAYQTSEVVGVSPEVSTRVVPLSEELSPDSVWPEVQVHLEPGTPLLVPDGSVLTITGDLSGTGEIIGNVVNHGVLRPGNSPGVIDITGDLTLLAGETTQIELAGNGGVAGTDYDQINVTGNVGLDGTLEIILFNGFTPTLGQTFNFLTYAGVLTGAFAAGTGLFGFGDGSLYLEIVEGSGVLQLEVKAVPGDGDLRVDPSSVSEANAMGLVFSDYFPESTATITGGLFVSDNELPLIGTFEFEKTAPGVIHIEASATGLLGDGIGTSGETGVKITSAVGAILANETGVAAK